MRRDTPTGIQGRSYEYGPHPVPQRAASYGHLALFFRAESSRQLGGDATGNGLAEEMCRQLRPSCRAALLT